MPRMTLTEGWGASSAHDETITVSTVMAVNKGNFFMMIRGG